MTGELLPSSLHQITAIGRMNTHNLGLKIIRCGNQASIMEVDDTLKMSL